MKFRNEGLLFVVLYWIQGVASTCEPGWLECIDTTCALDRYNCLHECLIDEYLCEGSNKCVPSAIECPDCGDHCWDGSCSYNSLCPPEPTPDPDHDSGFSSSIGWWRFMGIPVMIILVIAGAMCRLCFYRSHQRRQMAARGGVGPQGGMQPVGVPTMGVPPTSSSLPPAGSYPTQNYNPPAYPAANTTPYPPTSTPYSPAGGANPNGGYNNAGFVGPSMDLPPYPGHAAPPMAPPSAPPPSYDEVTATADK